jgi:hypothetical protein
MDKIGQIAQLAQRRLPYRRMSKALCSSTSGPSMKVRAALAF